MVPSVLIHNESMSEIWWRILTFPFWLFDGVDITQHHMMDIRRAISESNTTKVEVTKTHFPKNSAPSSLPPFSRRHLFSLLDWRIHFPICSQDDHRSTRGPTDLRKPREQVSVRHRVDRTGRPPGLLSDLAAVYES